VKVYIVTKEVKFLISPECQMAATTTWVII